MVVHQWSLEEPDPVVREMESSLSEDERRRAGAFTRADLRRRFVVARGRLRALLGARLEISAGEVVFRYGPNGKPELQGESTVRFNLAHSADLAICVVADHPVGVDLERVRPRKNAQGLAERWFHPDEQQRIAEAVDPLDEFYRTWVMKEAALKLVGIGVGESLPRVLTPAEPIGGVAHHLPASELGLTTCRLEVLRVAAGFSAAVAAP